MSSEGSSWSNTISDETAAWRRVVRKKHEKWLRGVIFSIGILAFACAQAHAWWDDKWEFRRKITFDSTASGADIQETLTDAPVLVRLHTGNFAFANAKEDGSDIRFVGSDDKAPLKFHKELYDPQLEIGLFWVKVPRIAASSNSDSMWMYFGNKAVSGGDDRGGTYDVNRVAVYHFDEPDGAPKDSTAYKNHASQFEGGKRTQGPIGNGVSFSGMGERIVIPKTPSLNFSNGLTFSAWIKIGALQENAYIFAWENEEQGIVFGIDQGMPYCRATHAGNVIETQKSFALPVEEWRHIAFTVKPSDKLSIYVDGSEVASVPFSGPLPEPSADMMVGASLKGEHSLIAEIDEASLSKIAAPAALIRTSYLGEGPDAALSAVGAEESGGGGGHTTYLHTILKNLTLDGWLICGILTLFGAFSAVVFLRKALLLVLMQKSNLAFLGSFRNTTDLILPTQNEDDESGVFDGSSIYEIYLAGCNELKRFLKIEDANPAAQALSPIALKSFNASIERAFIRESQKLNSWMVVLTMAIAGGPFLGLLGTVWGVMNTFAGMAEAGEANLAAIAPGIASALATTVFGLFVAIPSLFAYNYLIQKTKSIATELSLFVDEFLMKVEGNYGGHA